MKNGLRKTIILSTGKLILSFFILLTATYSCTEKKQEGLIPEKEFISILSESYLADGLLTIPTIRDKFSKRDTIQNYIEIIKSKGYTYDEMMKTLDYYFTNDPKKLSEMLDQILGKLSEMESVANLAQQQKLNAAAELIKTKFHFVLPDSAVKEKPGFSYDIIGPGTFRLMFSVAIYPSDQSLDPCFTAWTGPADQKSDGKITRLPVIRYLKDGRTHEYLIEGKIERTGPSVLKGFYFDYRNNPSWCDLYATIHNLNFTFLGKMPL